MLAPEGSFGLLLARHRTRLGLSQAGLAGLAGCSRQYVAQLEAGRKLHPSLRSTHALANALQLAGEERGRFFAAAGHLLQPAAAEAAARVPAGPALADGTRPSAVEAAEVEAGPALVRFDELVAMSVEAARATRLPAYVHDSLWRLRGWNDAALELFEVTPAGLAPGRLSILDFLFDPAYRERFLHWEQLARAALAQFKRDSRARLRHPEAAALLRRLRRLPDFRRLWRAVEVAPDGAPTLAVTLERPGGVTHLRVLRLRVLDHPDVWFNVFLPAGSSGILRDGAEPWRETRF